MHAMILTEGLTEGLQMFEKSLHKKVLGHSVGVLREMRMYSYQFDKRDKDVVRSLLSMPHTERVMKDGLNYSYEHKESPFKHGKVTKGMYLLAKYAGGMIGVEPFEPIKPTDKGYIPDARNKLNVSTKMINLYPVGIIPDNMVLIKDWNMKEEVL